jgi:peptidoglycan/xylan/chitin deacetylase (PgdA/CDA1 family)
MSADELRALAVRGIAIGAHTVGHPHLTLLDPDSQVREIAESRRVLERIGGVPVTHLAYPYGAFDETTAISASDAGITHAFTCEPRALATGQAPLRLPRLDPQESRLDRFIARVALSLVAHV